MSIELDIHDVAFGGSGVGRFEGKIAFVPFTIEGERVLAEILEHRKSFDRAKLRKIIVGSAHRANPVCPYFGRCGGCDYQHIAYEHQLEIKRRQVVQLLKRIGRITDIDVLATLPCPSPYEFRNRITVHARQGKIGFFEKNSRDVVDVEHCAIANPAVNEALMELRATGLQEGKHRTLRSAGMPRTFAQTNDFMAKALLEFVASQVTGEVLLDGYCGSGFFGHALAGGLRTIIGIDWNQPAIEIARESASANEIYICGDVAETIPSLLVDYRPQTVLLDPPADGLDNKAIDALATKPPTRLIYVSCNPATLARDLANLRKIFRITVVQPIDMFPQTAEIETVAVLDRLQ